MSRPDADFQGVPRLHGVDAPELSDGSGDAFLHGSVLAGEPKSLFGVEPLYDRSHGRTGGCLEPGSAEARPGAESTRLWVVGISVEVAMPRITEILMSHFSSWKVWCLDQFERVRRLRIFGQRDKLKAERSKRI